MAVLPSELYVRSALGGAEQGKEVTVALLALASAALALHGLAFWGFVRVLASPGVSGARRVRGRRARVWRIPGLSRGASAVAANQLRLAFRTPRGRSCLISPPLVFAILYVLLRRSPDGLAFGPIHLNSGAALAALASFVAMMATLPLAMNQFAIDRGGLTLAALAPLRTAELLRGKAVGNALAAAVPMGLCVGTSAILLPSGSPASWLSLPPAFVSIHLLVSPAAAILSAVFPRAVDLNSIGSGSNAHGAAGALGTLSFVAAGVPCAALAVLPAAVFARPALGPVVLTLWAAACAGAGAALFRLAENLFERRRENLLMIR